MLPDFLVGPRAAVREAVEGRASGIFNMAGFACYWAALGVSALPATLVAPGLVLAFAISGLTLWGGSRLRKQAKGLPAGDWGPDQVRRVRTGFLVIGAGEAVGFGTVVLYCGFLSRHWEWLGPAIAFPVGLHFFALAWLFRVPVYNLTGAALCALGLATILFVPAQATVAGQLSFFAAAPAPFWRLVPGLGASLVLWATCVVMLAGGREIVRRSGSGTEVSASLKPLIHR